MTMTSKFKKFVGVATVAAALGATALTAAPAQAQSFHFGFGTNNNNGPNIQFGIGNDHRYPGYGRDYQPGRHFYQPGRYCLSDSQLENRIERQGYNRVRVTDSGRYRAEAYGTRHGWLYRITADSCSGRILDTDRLRRA